MDAHDGQVPAPRRQVRLRRRAAEPTALPFAAPEQDTPRVADLSALLGEIGALRLTLQTDLSLAAAALDEGAQDLAAELVDGDLSEVRAFSDRAAARLAGLADAADAVPVLVPLRKRRILSAAPLMAAAAALIGFVAFTPGKSAQAPDTSLTSAAITGIELSRLASEGAPDAQLLLVAEELNDELAMLIAQAADDPVAAQQALLLLEQTTQVLAGQDDSGMLRGVMAETRALRQKLRESLPAVNKRPVRTVVRPALPVVPRVQDEPEKERSSSSAPKSSPKPASPKPSPSTAPTSAPEPPAEDPAPQGSEQPAGPLPEDTDNIPGV